MHAEVLIPSAMGYDLFLDRNTADMRLRVKRGGSEHGWAVHQELMLELKPNFCKSHKMRARSGSYS